MACFPLVAMALFRAGLCLLLVQLASCADEASLVAHTSSGSVRGFLLNGTRAWRGIRYAAAPLGDLRFRRPQPPSVPTDIVDTVDFAPACLQPACPNIPGRSGWNSLNLTRCSEDCLFLNVYAPQSDLDRHFPVMVYLHAGEFDYGGANDKENNWPYFANGQVILVTANVRLSVLGFAALESLRARDPKGSTGNYGMQDQRAVLKWVQQNIAQFGGDASRVTIFGESSGGTSVGYHMVTKDSWGLFSRAILESPGLTQSKLYNQAEENTKFGVAALTAAGSPACEWPAENQTWLSYPGLMVMDMTSPLATAASDAAGRALCAARPDCFVVSTTMTGGVALYGSGHAGHVAELPFIMNMTGKGGHSPSSLVQVRLSNPSSEVDCLLQADGGSLTQLLQYPPYADTFETDSSAPVVDGVELAEPIISLSKRSDALAPGVALLGGSNMDEGTEFMGETPRIRCSATKADFEAWAQEQFGPTLGQAVVPLYKPEDLELPLPVCQRWGHHNSSWGLGSKLGRRGSLRHLKRSDADDSSAAAAPYWMAAMRSAGDAAILCPAREMLFANQAKAGVDAGVSFWYYFRATPIWSINWDETATMGAFHGAEIPFVFGDNFELLSAGERALSQAMGCYWRNFATSGNPNEGHDDCVKTLNLPRWPAIGTHHDSTVIEFTNTTISLGKNLKSSQCDLFTRASFGSEALKTTEAAVV